MKIDVKKQGNRATVGSLPPGSVFFHNKTYWLVVERGGAHDGYSLDRGRWGNFTPGYEVEDVTQNVTLVVS